MIFRILIVDDEPNIRSGLVKGLVDEADQVVAAQDGTEALNLFRQDHHHLVITDLKMPGPISGLDLVKQIKHESPETLMLVITAHGSIETAVEAMRNGAHDYISKPVDLNMLRLLVRNACQHHRLVQENRELRSRLAAAGEFPEMIGQSRRNTRSLRSNSPSRRFGCNNLDSGRKWNWQRTRRPRPSQSQRQKARSFHGGQYRGSAGDAH